MTKGLSRNSNIGIAFACIGAIFLLLSFYTWWLLRRNSALSPQALERRKRTANDRSMIVARAAGRAGLGAWMIGEAGVPARHAQSHDFESGTSTSDAREIWRMSPILEQAKDEGGAVIQVPPPAYTKRTVPAYSQKEELVERGPDSRRWSVSQVDSRLWSYMGAMFII